MPDFKPARVLSMVLLAGALSLPLSGCYPAYSAGGSGASFDLYTYEGTPDNPRIVTVTDLATNQPIWTTEVPIGKQLVVRFYDDFDAANTTRPSLMRWEIMDLGEWYGQLDNAMPVPASYNRRIEPSFPARPGPAAQDPLALPPPPPVPAGQPPTPPQPPMPNTPPPAPEAPATPANSGMPRL